MYPDHTVARLRVLEVPAFGRFPEGVKYAFHYGATGKPHPIIRFDNHHGPHELHIGNRTYETEFPGLAPLYRAWRAALPQARRDDW